MAKKPKISQEQKVKNELNQFGFITSWMAWEKHRITRLSAIIFNLKAEGWDIDPVNEKNTETHWVKYVNKDFNPQQKFAL